MTQSLELPAKTSLPIGGKTESSDITVRIYPNPFDDEGVLTFTAPANYLVAEYILERETTPEDWNPEGDFVPNDEVYARVWNQGLATVDGIIIENDSWHMIRPQAELSIRYMPGNNNWIRIIGMLVIAVVAVVTQQYYLTALGPYGSAALGAAVGVVGNLALNHFVPPTLPKVDNPDTKKIQFLTSASNQVGVFSAIPVLYGTMRFLPPIPMTALPYTELVGDDQYFRVLYVLGYGPMTIGGVSTSAGVITQNTVLSGTPIRIADTPITNFTDYEFQIGTYDLCTLFTDSVIEDQVGVSMPRTGVTPISGYYFDDSDLYTRATATNADEVGIEVYFPGLFSLNKSGKTRSASVWFTVECRLTGGSGAWTMLDANWFVYSNSRDPIRQGKRFILPSRNQWDIRLTRKHTQYQSDEEIISDGFWTNLKTYRRDVQPFTVPNVICMAMRIRATEQFGGRLERLSIEATRQIKVYNGTSWVTQATRSPAYAYADTFIGNATKGAIATSKLDATAIKDWGDWCATNGLYYDAYITDDGTVLDRAREACAAGLATWGMTSDGKITVHREIVETARRLVNSANVEGFSTEYSYLDLPHAFRVTYINDTTWEQDEIIVYNDGYNSGTATRFDQLQLTGVVDADQAWKIARFHMGQLATRPERFTWQEDIGHLLNTRGQSIEIAHEALSVGLASGRIKTIAANKLTATVDEVLYMETGKTYALRMQRAQHATPGSLLVKTITTVTGGVTSITFSTAATDVNVGDLFTFGESGLETFKAKISRIEPTGGLKGKVTAVPAADDIFDVWAGTIPTYDPKISQTLYRAFITPPPPTILGVTADKTTSIPDEFGVPQLRLAIAFAMDASGFQGLQVEAQMRRQGTINGVTVYGQWMSQGRVEAALGILNTLDVESYSTYQIRVRAIRDELMSSWSATTTYTVGGIAIPEKFAGSAAGGSLLGNPGLGIARPYSSGEGFRPVGWYVRGAAESEWGYSDQERSTVKALQGGSGTSLNIVSMLFPVTDQASYEILLVGKSAGSSTISLRVVHLTASPAVGKLALCQNAAATFTDPEIQTSVATGTDLSAVVFTTSLVAYTRTYTPPAGALYASIQFTCDLNEQFELESIWVRDNATYGARVGTTLLDAAGNVLSGIDIENDYLVSKTLGGSILANPTLDAARYRSAGGALRPVGWFINGNAETEVAYNDPATRDSVIITRAGANVLNFLSQAFAVNDGTDYEIVIIAKNTGAVTIDLQVVEFSGNLTVGEYAIDALAAQTYKDPEVKAGSGTATGVISLNLTTSYQTLINSYNPTAGTKWASIRLSFGTNGERMEIDSIWLRDKSTFGAQSGTSLFDQNGNLLYDIDIDNDAMVGAVIGGSLIANPHMDWAVINAAGTALRPMGWFIRGNAETEVSYVTPATKDIARFAQNGGANNLVAISQAFPTNLGTKYEVTIFAKSTGSISVSWGIAYSASNLNADKMAISHLAASGLYNDPEIQASAGTLNAFTNLALTTTLTGFVGTWTPPAGSKWASLVIVLTSGQQIQIDSVWIRDTSTEGATSGASGNLKGDLGELLQGKDIRNDTVVRQALSFLNFNPSFDIPRYDSGVDGVDYPDAGTYVQRPAGWYQSDGTNSKPTYVDAQTRDEVLVTADDVLTGALMRVNPKASYEFVALIKSVAGSATIQMYAEEQNTDAPPSGRRFLQQAASEVGGWTRWGTKALTSVNTTTVTTSYTIVRGVYTPSTGATWFCPSVLPTVNNIHIEWFGVRERATEGATLGTDLKAGDGTTLLQGRDILNDEVIGSALGGSILANPTLDYAKLSVAGNTLRPQGWFLRGNAETELTWVDPVTRDAVRLTQNGGGVTLSFISSIWEVNTKTKYEIVIVAKSVNSNSIGCTVLSRTSRISAGKYAMHNLGAGTFTDSEVEVNVGSPNALADLVCTTSYQAFVREFDPPAGALIACILIDLGTNESIDIDSIWLREKSISEAIAGESLYDSAARLLQDSDVRNDRLAADILGGFLNDNADFSFPRATGITYGTPPFIITGLGPGSWFAANTNADAAKPYYPGGTGGVHGYPAGVDEISVPAATLLASSPVRINPGTRYEVAALVKAASGTPAATIYIEEYDTDLLPAGTKYIGMQGTGETGGVVSTRQLAATSGMTLSTSYALKTSVLYVPSATAKWFSISIYCATAVMTLDWMGVRTASTYGATSNVNIAGEQFRLDDFGHNSAAQAQATWVEFLAGNSPGEISVVSDPGTGWTYAMELGNNSGNDQVWIAVDRRKAVPLKKDKLYRISGWVKRTGGSGTIYLGVAGLKGAIYSGGGSWVNDTGANSLSNQHYFAASGVNPASWTYYSGVFKLDGIGYSTAGGTVLSPHRVHQDVTHVVPLIVANYGVGAGSAQTRVALIEIQELENFGATLGNNMWSNGGSLMGDADVRNSEARIWNFPQGSNIIWNSYGTTATDYSPSSGSGTTHDQTITVEVKDALGNIIRTRTITARVTFSTGAIDGSAVNTTTVDNITISSISNDDTTGITFNLTDAVTGKTTKVYASTVSTTTGGVGK